MKLNESTRNKTQKAQDEAFIADLLAKGYRVPAIRLRLNASRTYTLSERAIHDQVATLKKRWSSEAIDDLAGYLRREIMLLDWVQIEAIEAWERSKAEKAVQEAQTALGAKRKARAKTALKNQLAEHRRGKPRVMPMIDASSEFLHVILRVSERRAKLLGVGSPDRHEHSGAGGGPIPIQAGPLTLEVAVVDETTKKPDGG